MSGTAVTARRGAGARSGPRHIAIIMDGNGRWANARGLRRNAGHEAGEEALFRTVEGALAHGVQDLTVYAFSTENWRRSPDEVRFLLDFNRSLLLRRGGGGRAPAVRGRGRGSMSSSTGTSGSASSDAVRGRSPVASSR
jgi:undecaprenyl diphosphate synthase